MKYLAPAPRIILGLGVALMAGCAPLQPTIYKYSWGNIVKTTPNQVVKHCADKPGWWDNGKRRPRWGDVAGCYDWTTRSIWVKNDCEGAEALTHELAHMDGHNDPEKDGYGWDD